jgi:hypothetical protein
LRNTTNGDNQFISHQLVRLTCGIAVGDADLFGGLFDLADLHPQLNLEALFGKGFVRFTGDLPSTAPRNVGKPSKMVTSAP